MRSWGGCTWKPTVPDSNIGVKRLPTLGSYKGFAQKSTTFVPQWGSQRKVTLGRESHAQSRVTLSREGGFAPTSSLGSCSCRSSHFVVEFVAHLKRTTKSHKTTRKRLRWPTSYRLVVRPDHFAFRIYSFGEQRKIRSDYSSSCLVLLNGFAESLKRILAKDWIAGFKPEAGFRL